jgi:DNA replication protein DnaC
MEVEFKELLRTQPHSMLLDIATGEKECEVCHDKALSENDKQNCVCAGLKNWWYTFSENVPRHYRHLLMETLAPSDKSRLPFAKQVEVINQIRAEPTKSYAFFGPAGTSKTTFCVALFEQALWDNPYNCGSTFSRPVQRSIWRKSTKYLLDEFVAYSTGKEVNGKPAKIPSVNRRVIDELGRRGIASRPHLFLEEIDKVAYSKFKTDTLFEILDAIYENEGQLVFNTNLTIPEFEAQFGTKEGPAFTRRIGESMEVFNFF